MTRQDEVASKKCGQSVTGTMKPSWVPQATSVEGRKRRTWRTLPILAWNSQSLCHQTAQEAETFAGSQRFWTFSDFSSKKLKFCEFKEPPEKNRAGKGAGSMFTFDLRCLPLRLQTAWNVRSWEKTTPRMKKCLPLMPQQKLEMPRFSGSTQNWPQFRVLRWWLHTAWWQVFCPKPSSPVQFQNQSKVRWTLKLSSEWNCDTVIYCKLGVSLYDHMMKWLMIWVHRWAIELFSVAAQFGSNVRVETLCHTILSLRQNEFKKNQNLPFCKSKISKSSFIIENHFQQSTWQSWDWEIVSGFAMHLTFGVQEMWRVSEWMNHDSMTTVVGQLNNPLRLGCTHCEALPTMSHFVPKISGQSWRDVKIMGKLSDIPVFEISSERTALSQWKQRILQPENLRCWQSPEDCSCHVLEACPISKFCYNTQRTQQSNKVHQRALLCHKKKSWTSKKRSELL